MRYDTWQCDVLRYNALQCNLLYLHTSRLQHDAIRCDTPRYNLTKNGTNVI